MTYRTHSRGVTLDSPAMPVVEVIDHEVLAESPRLVVRCSVRLVEWGITINNVRLMTGSRGSFVNLPSFKHGDCPRCWTDTVEFNDGDFEQAIKSEVYSQLMTLTGVAAHAQ